MTLANNSIYFTEREKRLQQILKSDERFLEFLRDKDVNRKKLVDEIGRKVDVKGFVDLKKKYGLTKKDLKIEKIKKSKKIKAKENSNVSENVPVACHKSEANAIFQNNKKDSEETKNSKAFDAMRPSVDEQASKNNKPMMPIKETAISRNELSVKQLPKMEKETSKSKGSSKTKVEFHLDLEKMKKFSEKFEKKIEEEEENDNGDGEGEIHKEFTFTVSGPDEPQSGDDDEENSEGRGKKKSNKNRGGLKAGDKKISEAEKMDMMLLAMDLKSIKKTDGTNNDDDGLNSRGKKRKKKTIREEIEREVANEDLGQILNDPRFKSLMENPTFTIEEMKADAVKKRLLSRGK